MKTIDLILVTGIFILFISCTEQEPPVIKIGEPIIENGANFICVLPYLGFNGMNAPTSTLFDIYCDTVYPPAKIVIENTRARLGQRLPEEKRLEFGKTYYWKGVAKEDGYNIESDIFSFSTIEADSIFGRNWWLYFMIDEETYFRENFQNLRYYKKEINDSADFGDIFSFYAGEGGRIMHIGDPYKKVFPDTGKFIFNTDSVVIDEYVYDFINMGYHAYENVDPLCLVLRRRRDNILLIFKR